MDAAKKWLERKRRHRRVRKKVHGTAEQPRLNVFRSLKHIYAQLVDDDRGVTLAMASTLVPELKAKGKAGTKKDVAKSVGEILAQKAMAVGIQKVVFDRGGYKYHGRVKALAEGARAAGLQF
ncbi:MAG: 50S ribosomal protein L18 [candidate division NC10 bacterium]|nr:50S ribosomal protein L18 [candidate division NC10 bacterium]